MMKFWFGKVNKRTIFLYFILFLSAFLDKIDYLFLHFFQLQLLLLFLLFSFKTFFIGQRSLILLHQYSFLLHLLLCLIDKLMSVFFELVTVFIASIGDRWDGANSWKHFLWTYPLSCNFLALFTNFRVIINWRRREQRFVAVESLNVTFEKILRRIAIRSFFFTL